MARRRGKSIHPTREFEESSLPIYAVRERHLSYANPALGRWLKTDPAELIGLPCGGESHQDSLERSHRIASQLAPPRELEERETCSTFVLVPEDSQPRIAHGIRLVKQNDDVATVWVSVTDTTVDVWRDGLLQRESEAARLRAQLQDLRQRYASQLPPALLGRSELVERVREQIATLSLRLAPTLIYGPAGIGREEVARYLYHRAMAQRETAGELFAIACPLMDGQLVQSSLELFAGTRADSPHSGLLLMDVDELNSEAQAVLGNFLRTMPISESCVVLSTSRRELTSEDADFDQALALRLTTFSVRLPSLAERPGDIALIAQQLVETHSRGELSGFDSAALDRIASYHWPENIAELSEVVAQAVSLADRPQMGIDGLPELFDYADDAALHPRRRFEPIRLDAFLEDVERELLSRALLAAQGNKTETARLLGVSRQRVIRRAAQWKLGPWNRETNE